MYHVKNNQGHTVASASTLTGARRSLQWFDDHSDTRSGFYIQYPCIRTSAATH
jgi:hypothetical protein